MSIQHPKATFVDGYCKEVIRTKEKQRSQVAEIYQKIKQEWKL